MRDIARFHSIYLDDVARLLSEPWMCVYSGNVMKALSGFWRALLHQNHVSFPDLWPTARYKTETQHLMKLRHDTVLAFFDLSYLLFSGFLRFKFNFVYGQIIVTELL